MCASSQMSLSPSSSSGNQKLQQLLPTCQRCRRLRRKCDTQLPACRLCQKAGEECTVFDHALQQALPRSYIKSLFTRLERLQAMKSATTTTSPKLPPSLLSGPETSPATAQDSAPPISPEILKSVPPVTQVFDQHFIIESDSGPTSRFFGSSSAFALTVEVLSHANSKLILPRNDAIVDSYSFEAAQSEMAYVQRQSPSHPDHLRSLLAVYFNSIHLIYGFLDQSIMEGNLQSYLTIRSQQQSGEHRLRGDEAHDYFRISMICAIASAVRGRYHQTLLADSLAYYAEALSCVEEVTSEASASSLQALFLLIIFCLFFPRRGDIWKLLDYACRLSVELGFYAEDNAEQETESQRSLRRSTFWALYALERIIGQLLGRASDLPEPIITTEYPHTLTNANLLDQITFQRISVSHQYRLVFLRSEIFRDLYLTASDQGPDFNWYRERYLTLLAWRQELEVTDDLTGPGTVTADVGYHAGICFLCQRLMLQALAQTAEIPTDTAFDVRFETIPQENYWSACALVRAYEQVLRAPEDSALGVYPITFMSAHYIYIASMTIMAHCLLALDGRVRTVTLLGDLTEEPPVQLVNFGDLYEISGSCLVLLAYCVARWPGMVGMLDVYKKLSENIFPAMVRRGLL